MNNLPGIFKVNKADELYDVHLEINDRVIIGNIEFRVNSKEIRTNSINECLTEKIELIPTPVLAFNDSIFTTSIYNFGAPLYIERPVTFRNLQKRQDQINEKEITEEKRREFMRLLE